MSNFEQFFPFGTAYSTWEDWNGNLLSFYGQEPVSYSEEDQWKDVIRNLINLPTFSVYGIPDPDLFENWQDWAEAFTLIVNGPSK
jgi:hypothetical protein